MLLNDNFWLNYFLFFWYAGLHFCLISEKLHCHIGFQDDSVLVVLICYKNGLVFKVTTNKSHQSAVDTLWNQLWQWALESSCHVLFANAFTAICFIFAVLSLAGLYRAFHRFGQAKFVYGGPVLGSSQFLLLPQLPQKMRFASKVVKIDSKIIISLH